MAGFFVAAGFAAVVFFAGATAFLTAGLAAGAVAALAFLAVFSFTPAAFAAADNFDLRLAAVFFLIKPFLTAVSISL